MRLRTLAQVTVSLGMLLIPLASVFAHEPRQVAGYEMIVGWVEEPAYAGFRNGVQLRLNDGTGKPVLDLGDALKVEVIYGRDKTEPAALVPAFSEKFGRQGEYRMAIIPTRPGAYTFHFFGTIKGQKIDESFTASEKTFDLVQSPTEIEFPAKDPTQAELALRIQRIGPRVDKLRDSLDTLKRVTAVSLGVGLAGLIAALAVARSRRPQ